MARMIVVIGVLLLLLASGARAEESGIRVISMLGDKPHVFSQESGFPGRYRWLEPERSEIGIDQGLSEAMAAALSARDRLAQAMPYAFDRDLLYARRNDWLGRGYDARVVADIMQQLHGQNVPTPYVLLVQHQQFVPMVMGEKRVYGYGLMRHPRYTSAFMSVRALLVCEPSRVCNQATHWVDAELPGYVTSRPLADPSELEWQEAKVQLHQLLLALADGLSAKLLR